MNLSLSTVILSSFFTASLAATKGFKPSSNENSGYLRRLSDSTTKWTGKDSPHPFSRGRCTEQKVLIRGEEAFSEEYAFATYDIEPKPGDRELFNLRLYDIESFFDESKETLILGYVNEELAYLPPADFAEELDCVGQNVWTFYDPNEPGKLTGQVSDRYTCFGFDSTIITGGSLDYACAEGFVELVDVTDGFFEGAGPDEYIIWNIVNCGRCDKRNY